MITVRSEINDCRTCPSQFLIFNVCAIAILLSSTNFCNFYICFHANKRCSSLRTLVFCMALYKFRIFHVHARRSIMFKLDQYFIYNIQFLLTTLDFYYMCNGYTII